MARPREIVGQEPAPELIRSVVVALRGRLIPQPLLRKRRRGAFNDLPTGLFRTLLWLPFSFSEKGSGDEAPAEADNARTYQLWGRGVRRTWRAKP